MPRTRVAIRAPMLAAPVGIDAIPKSNVRTVVLGNQTASLVDKKLRFNPPIVNPVAMILSAAMMLDHIGERDKADQIRAAIAAVIAEGKVRTYDMMRIPGGPKSIAQGAASTTELTDAIVAKLGVAVERAYAGSSTT